jgi:hypothetical protein
MANKIDNERKACDAVARCLENLLQLRRSNARSPEDDKVGPPVEYLFDLGNRKYAMEHTVVEAFIGQIQTDVEFGLFVTPIADVLDYQLPVPGVYRLYFPIQPGKGIKTKRHANVQEKIIEWVRKTAAELHSESPEQPRSSEERGYHSGFRKETIEGIQLQLSRQTDWHMPDEVQGRLFPIRFAPEDYENLRRERLKRTMSKKLPKLQSWKRSGARSVLVLENRDIAISSHVSILEAAEHALEMRADRPDEVWLVDTTIKKEWTVWCLIREGLSLPDEYASIRFKRFSPCELTEV